MQLKKALPSLVAGVLTPFALLLLGGGLLNAQGLRSPLSVGLTVVTAGILLVLGISLWKPISPLQYGLTVTLTFVCIAGACNRAFHGGNLTGLVVLLVIAYGVPLGVAVAIFGPLLQRARLPRWAALVPLAAVIILALVAFLSLRSSRQQHSRRIAERIEEMRLAELADAAAQPDHPFTCNGPDLPDLTNIEWRTNEAMGLQKPGLS